jgi:hypothetical protein
LRQDFKYDNDVLVFLKSGGDKKRFSPDFSIVVPGLMLKSSSSSFSMSYRIILHKASFFEDEHEDDKNDEDEYRMRTRVRSEDVSGVKHHA